VALNKLVVLVGGVGGAKLAHGLMQVFPAERLTIIVNTGDDFWLYGLRICPDFDTVMYTLAGLVNPVNGWGVAGDTVVTLDALRRFGEEPWFRLGDQDLATHLLRTEGLRGGERWTSIAARLTKSLGIPSALLPMTDDESQTMIDTVRDGRLAFQEYFVRHKWQPVVRSIDLSAAKSARITPEVSNAIREADAILIAPSNPWLSIAPILAMPGMRDLLFSRPVPRVAISPIVGGKAIKGPAAKIMMEMGFEVSARSVAKHYGEIINGFIYDEIDVNNPPAGLHSLATDTMMRTESDRARLANEILSWIESWRI
jgi:LPPG:FO 2-phospho-L-lactate transferase